MRTLSANITNAQANERGIKPVVKLDVYRSRVFLLDADLDDANPSPYIQTPGIRENNVQAQGCGLIGAYVVTAMPKTGSIHLHVGGTNVNVNTGLDTFNWCKPAFLSNVIYYVDASSHHVVASTIDISALVLGNACITGTSDTGITAEPGAVLYPYDANTIYFMGLDEGGVSFGVYINSGGWSTIKSASRFMFPSTVWDDDDSETSGEWDAGIFYDAGFLNYSTMARTGTAAFYYLTAPTGEVLGVKYDNGTFSDTFVAVPKDLTKFLITNSFVDAFGRIHMMGQFTRTEESFDTVTISNLLLWSDDGKVFSIDRNTLVSTVGYRFHALKTTTGLVFVDGNVTGTTTGTYSVFRTGAEVLHIPEGHMEPLSGGSNSDWSIILANANEQYTNHALLVEGGMALLYIGMYVSASIEWVLYDTCVITSIQEEWADGVRHYSMQISPEGLWRIAVMTYPFYLEFQSKQSIRDDAELMNNLYLLSASTAIPEPFHIEFWDGTGPELGGGLTVGTHGAGGTITYKSADTVSKNMLSDYPIIESFPIAIKVYGWSRIGLPSTNPNTADNTPDTNPNDTVSITLYIKRNESGQDNDRVITIPAGTAQDGITYFPQYWKEGNSRLSTGDMPVIFNVDNAQGLNVGDEIVQVEVNLSSSSPTVSHIERIEIPEVNMFVVQEDQGWEIEVTPAETYLTTDLKGVPCILFSAKPYTAFNFQATGEFHIVGDNTWVGLVGMASDIGNYLAARVDADTVQLISVREGIETVLATDTFTAPARFYMLFEHRDGNFTIRVRSTTDPNIWSASTIILSYSWNFLDGPMSTSADLFHIGVYSFIDVPKFRIASFYLPEAEGIPMLVGYDKAKLDDFPASGTVDIDGYLYTYTGKTANSLVHRGPYQLRNTGDWNYDNPDDAEHYDGETVEMLFFEWKSNPTNHNQYAGYLIGSNAGYCWTIIETDWKAFTITGGATVWLLNRSRWFCNNTSGGSLSDRLSIVSGLTGISASPENTQIPMHSEGSFCFLHSDNRADVYQFCASSGDKDATIADLIDSVSAMSGARATFSGDIVIASLTLNGSGTSI